MNMINRALWRWSWSRWLFFSGSTQSTTTVGEVKSGATTLYVDSPFFVVGFLMFFAFKEMEVSYLLTEISKNGIYIF